MNLDYRNIATLLSLNTINVILNVVNSTLMVYFFGTSAEVEAFFAASVLGTTVSRFVNAGQLVEVVVARYHRIKSEVNTAAAMSIVATLANYIVGIAFVLVLLFIASGTDVVNLLVPGFKLTTKEQVWQIFCFTGFLLPIQIATNVFQGMLNAENIYGKTEFTSTISQLVHVLILCIWGRDGNIWSLVAALFISVLAQFGTVVYYLRHIHYRHTWLFRNPHFPLRELSSTLLATSTYMGGVQVYTFIFNAALSLLPSGTYALFRYAELIYGKVANVFLIPVSTVFFNEINRLLHQNNGQLIKAFVAKNLNFSYFIGFLVLIPFVAGGQYLIWTLWGGVKFNAQDVESVYQLLCVFFAAMICTGPYMIYRKLAVSVTNPELQYYFWSVVHVLSALFSYFIIQTFGFTGVLIHLFTHSTFMALVPLLTVWTKKKAYFGFYERGEVFKITFAFLVSVGVGWVAKGYWHAISHYNKLVSFFIGASLAGVATLVFIGICLLLKVTDLQIIRGKIGKRISK